MNEMKEHPVIFVSYSWEDEEHKKWAVELVNKLRENGADAHIDQYDLDLGDRLPQFMEQEITKADFVLIICTPNYKEKADNRTNGVGYEGHIISAELLNNRNEKKFIPIIRKGGVRESFPIYLSEKLGIDFKDDSKFDDNFNDLLATIYGQKQKPRLGSVPSFSHKHKEASSTEIDEAISIIGIVTNEVTVPKMDGTRGSALYKIPFKLSRTPSRLWEDLFIQSWNSPPKFTTMHRSRIASVSGDKIILDGTTIEEVKSYHRETLLLCVDIANKEEKEIISRNAEIEREKRLKIQEHYQDIEDISKDIKW